MKKAVQQFMAAVWVAIGAGCHSSSQYGTFSGFQGFLGTHTIEVKFNGAITDQYGPGLRKGNWVAVSNGVIKATFRVTSSTQAKGNESGDNAGQMVKYYKLDYKERTFAWTYSLESLVEPIGAQHFRPESLKDADAKKQDLRD